MMTEPTVLLMLGSIFTLIAVMGAVRKLPQSNVFYI